MSFETTPAGWRPLGEVIVERGLITPEQLEDALLEQRITQKRLGTILIDKGIVSAQDLTDALVDQIGFEELIGELNDSPEPEDLPGRYGPSVTQPFRRPGSRLRIKRPSGRRRGGPFSRLGSRGSGFGRRDDHAPVAPFAISPAFDSYEAFGPIPTEEVEPETETAGKPGTELAAEPEGTMPKQPHAWLAAARAAFDKAEAEIERLDDSLISRSHELREARAELADREAEIAQASRAQRQAQEEVASLHALIDERDAGLTTLEATNEELRQATVLIQGQLEASKAELAKRTARVAELEARLGDHEARGARIVELEAHAAELAENLSATDETLGFEMHAREQAQRDAKGSREELHERDARVAELAAQVEALEKEFAEAEPAAAPLPPQPEPDTAPQATDAPLPIEPKSDGFVCFLPRAGEGYGLVERPGVAPAVGDTIEIEGTRYEVTRNSRSPMPFDRRTCVYLRAVS